MKIAESPSYVAVRAYNSITKMANLPALMDLLSRTWRGT